MKYSIICAFFVALLWGGCTEQVTEPAMISLTINTSNPSMKEDAHVRTEIRDFKTYWGVGDAIGVVADGANNQFKTDITEPSLTASFTGKVSEKSKTLYFYYPYQKNAPVDGSKKTVKLILPSNQKPLKTSFDPQADLLWAEPQYINSQTPVAFKRKTAILCIQLVSDDFADLSQRTIEGLKIEIPGCPLTGEAILNLGNGKLVPDENGHKSAATVIFLAQENNRPSCSEGALMSVFPNDLSQGEMTIKGKINGTDTEEAIFFEKKIVFNFRIAMPANEITTFSIPITKDDIVHTIFSWDFDLNGVVDIDDPIVGQNLSSWKDCRLEGYIFGNRPFVIGSGTVRGSITTRNLQTKDTPEFRAPFTVTIVAKDFNANGGENIYVKVGKESEDGWVPQPLKKGENTYIFEFGKEVKVGDDKMVTIRGRNIEMKLLKIDLLPDNQD